MIESGFEAYRQRLNDRLGLDRQDDLSRVQRLLDGWYPHAVRVRQLHQGVLRIVTPASAVAGELRMRQVELYAACEAMELSQPVKRIAITVGSIEAGR